MSSGPAKKPWGGRFNKATDAQTEAFTESISFDRVLYKHDIAGSMAHATMLAQVGLISQGEKQLILKGLSEILEEIESGTFNFRAEFEDIHMNVEKALEEKIGEAAGKLHTARSRNDQIALDERLWLRDEIDDIRAKIAQLQASLVELADAHVEDVMPGYTHLQRAQPVTVGHYLLAFVEMLQRDFERFGDCRKRTNILPLGACALAGSSLPIDRQIVADLLKFDGVTRNSMDTTADRDFLLEFAFCQTACALHLSRLSEDFVLMASTEFGFITIDDGFCTGSSIMPQKKNPDLFELVRGKTGRSFALLSHLVVLTKGLPMTYNRDMQEDKELLFNTVKQFKNCLDILAVLMRNVHFIPERLLKSCEEGYMDATALAEYLVRKNIPFRQAHHVVGNLVRMAEERGCALSDLRADEFKSAHAFLTEDVRAFLGARSAVKSYASLGSANPKLVRKEIESWKVRLRDEGALGKKKKRRE
ncbi:MAG TPA: argininosuccinate lyase [Planctomycetota bacterium]|nr:argininosuccinate lyase [Planctomycetota bacterium]